MTDYPFTAEDLDALKAWDTPTIWLESILLHRSILKPACATSTWHPARVCTLDRNCFILPALCLSAWHAVCCTGGCSIRH